MPNHDKKSEKTCCSLKYPSQSQIQDQHFRLYIVHFLAETRRASILLKLHLFPFAFVLSGSRVLSPFCLKQWRSQDFGAPGSVTKMGAPNINYEVKNFSYLLNFFIFDLVIENSLSEENNFLLFKVFILPTNLLPLLLYRPGRPHQLRKPPPLPPHTAKSLV